MPERQKRNKYIRTEVDADAGPVEEVRFVWTQVMRTEEFLFNRKKDLRRSWPELADALDRLVKAGPDADITELEQFYLAHSQSMDELEATELATAAQNNYEVVHRRG